MSATLEPAEPGLYGLAHRRPPSNEAAEMALLGALLANNKAYDRVGEFLAAEHFADPVHGVIYGAIVRRIENGQLADAVTLRAQFQHSGQLDQVGGVKYLAELLGAMVGILPAGEYGTAIRDAWLRRQLIELGEQVVNRAFGGADHVAAKDQIEIAEQGLFDLATQRVEGGFRGFDRVLSGAIEQAARAFSRSGGVSGLTTGLRDLDAKTGGLHPSDLVVLAGRPGMGKTALATAIAFGAARGIMGEVDGRPASGDGKSKLQAVAIFSLEMSAEQLGTRMLAESARVSGDRIRRGDIGQKDFDRFVLCARELSAIPVQIDDTAAITLSAMRTRCRRLARTRGLALVVVDYLQLMRPSAGTRFESRVLEISMITQGLKALAKELSVPVLALSQLSRAVESREDKRPQLSDLRESGSIEQDADSVLFVYRDEYYLAGRQPKPAAFATNEKYLDALEKWDRDMKESANKAELIIGKQRHGPTGTVELFFEGEFTRFGNLARENA